MRAIQKGPEPATLRSYRATPGATYDGKDFTPVKNDIRGALLRNQAALCCYCMRRISSDARPRPTKPDVPPVIQMKVEHWSSQHDSPELQLAWINMLGACLGNEGAPRPDQTCDTRKGDDPITLNPQDPTHVATLYCKSDGRLESTDPRFQADIDERLGLNHRILMDDRKACLDRALDRLKAKYPKSQIPESALRALVDEMEAPVERRLRAFASVLRLWARKRFGGRW